MKNQRAETRNHGIGDLRSARNSVAEASVKLPDEWKFCEPATGSVKARKYI